MNTFPPGTILVAKNVQLGRSNFGCHFNNWPFSYTQGSGAAYTYNEHIEGNYTVWLGDSVSSTFFDSEQALAKVGWIRSFKPKFRQLFDVSGSTVGAITLADFLRYLDWAYARGVKVLWIPELFDRNTAGTTHQLYSGTTTYPRIGFAGDIIQVSSTTVTVDSTASPGAAGILHGILNNEHRLISFDGSPRVDYRQITVLSTSQFTFEYDTGGLSNSLNVYWTNPVAEAKFRDDLVSLFTNSTVSPVYGFTLINHPALGAIEPVNEMTSRPYWAWMGPYVRLLAQALTRYRNPALDPVIVLSPNLEGIVSSDTAGAMHWLYAPAGTGNSDSPVRIQNADLSYMESGAGKRLIDYISVWSHHVYGDIVYAKLANNANTAFTRAQGNIRQGGFLRAVMAHYWYGPSGVGSGESWKVGSRTVPPAVWDTEGDLDDMEVEQNGYFIWGKLPLEERKVNYLKFMIGRMLGTADGLGGIGTTFQYLLDTAPGSGVNTQFVIKSGGATVSPDGHLRLSLKTPNDVGAPYGRARADNSGNAKTINFQGWGEYDDFIIYAPSGWDLLGLTPAKPYARYRGKQTLHVVAKVVDISALPVVVVDYAAPTANLFKYGTIFFDILPTEANKTTDTNGLCSDIVSHPVASADGTTALTCRQGNGTGWYVRVGDTVHLQTSTYDLPDVLLPYTTGTVLTVPTDVTIRTTRTMYIDIPAFNWVMDMLTSKPISVGFIVHPQKENVQPNLGIVIQQGNDFPYYTDAQGALQRWYGPQGIPPNPGVTG
jgi:hypothetical protein